MLLALISLFTALLAPPAPGFTITFDGGPFKAQTVVFKPLGASYANNYWRSTRDPRVDRLVLVSETASGVSLNFGAAPRVGVTAFDRKDEDDPNRNPYMRFDLHVEDWKPAIGYRFDLVHVDVSVTKMEAVGGRIEGTFQGTYELCTLPGDGGGNCTARAPLKISGSFSVVRIKDRVVD